MKDVNRVGKKMDGNGRKTAIYTVSFESKQSIQLQIQALQVTEEKINIQANKTMGELILAFS